MFFFILEYYKFIIIFTLYIFRFYKELLIAALSLYIYNLSVDSLSRD